MRNLLLTLCLLLTACASAPPVKPVLVYEMPPDQFMAAPATMQALPAGPVQANTALSVIVGNVGVARQNEEQLRSLEAWIVAEKAKVDELNKTKKGQ